MEVGRKQIKDLAAQAYNQIKTRWEGKEVTFFSRKDLNSLLEKPGVKPLLAVIVLILAIVPAILIAINTTAKPQPPAVEPQSQKKADLEREKAKNIESAKQLYKNFKQIVFEAKAAVSQLEDSSPAKKSLVDKALKAENLVKALKSYKTKGDFQAKIDDNTTVAKAFDEVLGDVGHGLSPIFLKIKDSRSGVGTFVKVSDLIGKIADNERRIKEQSPKAKAVETPLVEEPAEKIKSAGDLAVDLKNISSKLQTKGFNFFQPNGLPIINNMIKALELYEKTKNLDEYFKSEKAKGYEEQPNNIRNTFVVGLFGTTEDDLNFSQIQNMLLRYDPDRHFGKPGAISRDERDKLLDTMTEIYKFTNAIILEDTTQS